MTEDREDEGGRPQAGRGLRRVFVRDLELMASIGIFEVEKRYQQRIIVSVELDVIDDYDGQSDRLDAVVNYAEIVGSVRTIADSRHFNLVETLAERIGEACLADRRVLAVRITVEKPDVVTGCRSVGIAIERTAPRRE